MIDSYALAAVAVMAAVTAALRFLPFLVFNGKRSVPKVVRYLGAVLPYSTMAMLVVYCLKDVSFGGLSGWVPAAVSVAAVVLLHVWKRNTLLSIIGGTVCYMVLIRVMM
ncbi:MAG: AzlD domain-containing protein [Oscillospiraceae bacterium]|nr:AzlD domain-containing protein [Oscillospiraceae bacterium]